MSPEAGLRGSSIRLEDFTERSAKSGCLRTCRRFRPFAAGLSTGGDDAAGVDQSRTTPVTEVVVQIFDADEPIAVVYFGLAADAGNPPEHPHRALHGNGRG